MKDFISYILHLERYISFALTLAGVFFLLGVIVPNDKVQIVFIASAVFLFFYNIWRENRVLKNPNVDFRVTVDQDSVYPTNAYWFDNDRRIIMSEGEFQIFVWLEIVNIRQNETSIRFVVQNIDSDLPVSEQVKKLTTNIANKASGQDITLPPSKISVVGLKIILSMEFNPIEDSLPKIGNAEKFKITVRAQQHDNGYIDFELDMQNPSEKFGRIVEDQIKIWIDHPVNKHGVSGANEITNYLKLLWKNE